MDPDVVEGKEIGGFKCIPLPDIEKEDLISCTSNQSHPESFIHSQCLMT
jgi:hypothetical protein